MTSCVISEKYSGQRLDIIVSGLFPEISRSLAANLIESGNILLDGRAVKKNHRVTGGETLLITLSVDLPETVLPENIPLNILLEDDDIIVVNKPRGMVVHPAPGHPVGTLVNALMHHCGSNLSDIGGEYRAGIVHRLDRDTSGLLIAAKNNFSHTHLSAQLKERSVSRIYEAIASGRLRESEGTVNAPIGRHPTNRLKMAVTDKNSREAVTHYRVLAYYNGYTYLELRLQTGRTHQIRVHMAHLGHPLLGDQIYGQKKSVKKLEGQCLHARTLKFFHPRSLETVTVTSNLPDYFAKTLKRLGNELPID